MKQLNELSLLRRILWVFAGLVGFVIINLIFSDYNATLNPTGYTILDFEFSWTTEQMDLVLVAWDPYIDTAILFLWVDMIYPVFYVLLLTGLSLMTTPKTDPGAKAQKIAFYSAIIAGFCDWIENIASLLILYNPNTYPEILVFIVSIFALIKFILLPMSIFVILWHPFYNYVNN